MFDKESFSEGIEPMTRIPAASYNSVQNSGWVSLATHNRVVFILSPNVITATGTLDFKLQRATDSSGTGVVDFAGKAITQLAAGTITKEYVIEVLGEEMPAGFTHVRAVVTPATAASTLSLLGLGVSVRNAPVPQTNYGQVVKL